MINVSTSGLVTPAQSTGMQGSILDVLLLHLVYPYMTGIAAL